MAKRKFRPEKRTVFVLGAGFTKAVATEAPLLTDDYDISRVERIFASDPFISRIIDRNKVPGGLVKLETLLGRAIERMPYDIERESDLQKLGEELTRVFVDTIRNRSKVTSASSLARFARWCVNSSANCLTFNYDLVLDEALFDVNPRVTVPDTPEAYWHPDGGYGFFLPPSRTVASTDFVTADTTSMTLLKLHGSLNWFAKRAAPRPLRPDLCVHDTKWANLDSREFEDSSRHADELILRHIEALPFIVPPLTSKAAFYGHPILSMIWDLAFEFLTKAEQIVFIGFSIPESDQSAKRLFEESISRNSDVHVVGRNYCKELKRRYESMLPANRIDFHWGGGEDWITGSLPVL